MSYYYSAEDKMEGRDLRGDLPRTPFQYPDPSICSHAKMVERLAGFEYLEEGEIVVHQEYEVVEVSTLLPVEGTTKLCCTQCDYKQ